MRKTWDPPYLRIAFPKISTFRIFIWIQSPVGFQSSGFAKKKLLSKKSKQNLFNIKRLAWPSLPSVPSLLMAVPRSLGQDVALFVV